MTSMSISATDKLTVKRRETCKTCTNPLKSCLCEALPDKKDFLQYNVIILQHPKEARKKSLNTVLLLKLCIENCFVYVDIDFSQGRYPILDKALDNNSNSNLINYILYPGPGAQSIKKMSQIVHSNNILNNYKKKGSNCNNENYIHSRPTLIAIDGTWKQAKFIIHSNPRILSNCNSHLSRLLNNNLLNIDHLKLQVMLVEDVEEDEYLRTEPRTHYMATAIAVGRALESIDLINGSRCSKNLLKLFNHMQSITKKYQGTPKKKFTFQSSKDFDDKVMKDKIKTLVENLSAKYIRPSDKDKFKDMKILHHQIIIAYPCHKKDSSVVFKRLEYIDKFTATVPQAKGLINELNKILNRVRGQRLTIYTEKSWNIYEDTLVG